jgi:hypothetical protein
VALDPELPEFPGAPGAPAGPVRPGGPGAGRQDVCRRRDGDCAGGHRARGESGVGLRPDGYGERHHVRRVPAEPAGPWAADGCGLAGGAGRGQGAGSGGPGGLRGGRPWSSGAPGTSARTWWPTCPSTCSSSGGPSSSGPGASRPTRRRGRSCSVCTRNCAGSTKMRPAVWPKGWRRP